MKPNALADLHRRPSLSLILLSIGLAISPSVRAELQQTTVEYREGDTVLEGVQVFDNTIIGKRPGVLVVHQWTGVSDYEIRRAGMLAELGYNVFVADIYGQGVRPEAPEASGLEAAKYKEDRALFRRRLLVGLQVLREHELTETGQLGAIGYCFGGTGVLELARSGADIDGVVSFHGGLDSPNPKDGENIEASVLVLHGAEDPYVPAEEVLAFKEEMRAAKVDWQMVTYGNAVHSFTQPNAGDDPSKGAAYNRLADLRSWRVMRGFFMELFEIKPETRE